MHTHVLQRTEGGEGSSSAEFTVLTIKPSLSTLTLAWRHTPPKLTTMLQCIKGGKVSA